jgi:hypothetical protein
MPKYCTMPSEDCGDMLVLRLCHNGTYQQIATIDPDGNINFANEQGRCLIVREDDVRFVTELMSQLVCA